MTLQQRGLQAVEPRAPPDDLVLVLRDAAVVAQTTDLDRQRRVAADDGAAVAHRAEVLAGVEAERGGVAHVADADAAVVAEVGLRGVLEHEQPTVDPRRDVRRRDDVAEEVHRDDGSGARR